MKSTRTADKKKKKKNDDWLQKYILKELSEVYNDQKAEHILSEINEKRKGALNSGWEWKLIDRIWKETELLSDEAYTTIKHAYDLRNFSAHPAMNDDYELISPSAEMTVAYIKKALEADFINLIRAIDSNDQIYGYGGQRVRNDRLLKYAFSLLPSDFAFENYPNFKYTLTRDEQKDRSTEDYEEVEDTDWPF